MACDAEDCGFQMLKDDDSVTFEQEESDPVDNETDEDEDNNSKGPSNVNAFSVLETAMEWYEKQSKCCPIQLLLLKRIKDLVTKKRKCRMYSYTSAFSAAIAGNSSGTRFLEDPSGDLMFLPVRLQLR
ncbi:hypothetical protein TNCV_1115171 [Trichonephila clavipes]|nr:hypothetical protein TNCV_1115171 [Trichonephila clavipes]